MPNHTTPSAQALEWSPDFQSHLYECLGTAAVDTVRDWVNSGMQGDSIEFTLGNLPCTLKPRWKKAGDNFFFLAEIEPKDSEYSIGDAYPFMRPPVNPDQTEPESVSPKSVYLYAFKPSSIKWFYVFCSDPANTDELDTELDKVANLPDEIKTSASLRALSLTVEDAVSKKAWHGGLYVFGKLGLDVIPNWDDFKTYFGLDQTNSPSLNFHGLVHYPRYFPQLTLRLLLVTNFGSGALKLEKAYLVFSAPTYHVPTQTDIGFGAKIGIGSETLSIEAIWPIGGDRIKAKAAVEGSLPFVDTATVPGLREYTPEGKIELDLELSISEKSIKRVEFDLEVEHWVLIDKVLVLEDLKFSITVLDPGTLNLVMATISADALLGSSGTRLIAQGDYPSEQFSFQLDPTTPIDINQLLGSFTSKHPNLPNLKIDQFQGWMNFRSGYASFSTGASGSWKPGLFNIELKDLRFNISKSETWSFGVWSTFCLKDVDFNVSALYNDGWFFSAKAKEVRLSEFISALSSKTTLPAVLKLLTLSEMLFEFETNSGDYQIGGSGAIPINGVKVEAEIHIEAQHNEGTLQTAFSGRLVVAENYFFDVIFNKDGEAGSILVAAYHDEGNKHLQLGDLLNEFGIYSAPSLNVQVKDAFLASGEFVGEDSNKKKNNLFVSDIEGGINLSKLPLVGELLHGDKSVRLAFHVQWAQDAFDEKAVGTINAALPEGIPHLEIKEWGKNKKGLPESLGLAISMELGAEIIPIEFPLTAKENPDQGGADHNDGDTTSVIVQDTKQPPETDVKWFTVQKNIGPVYFSRVGVSYKDNLFTFAIDASLSMGGLALSLNGLSASSLLSKFDPIFDLKGLGLEFKNGPLEIDGAFLREQVTSSGETEPHDEYSGMAILKTEALSLMAMGSYTRIQGHPSLFLYAILNKPIGGPAFFFVEALAAGFGYNRQLIVPAIDKVATFPLVEAAMSGKVPDTIDPSAELQKLRTYIPPSVGDIFLAIGVKFNSFKQIDSFALLMLSFGHRFELHLLGLSNLVVPSKISEGKSPLARIEMALAATFVPEEGFLGVQAQLTSNSYILSKACKLTGGFAFFSWFARSHEGDFVATLGGYHPAFNVPPHYPQHVPRLGFNWIVDSSTTIKGEAYYALCSHAFMVGGHLEASYHKGAFSASFKAGADFLIAWKPYHYDAHIYVDLIASYTYHFFGTHHITADLGANIHLSGPEFGGTAKVHIWVVSVSVSFGSGMGAPSPITWGEFKESFLPKDDVITSITVNRGLVSAPEPKDREKDSIVNLGVVNPKEFQLTIESVIPSNEIKLIGITSPEPWTFPTEKDSSKNKFGIGSMGIVEIKTSNTRIEIKKENGSSDNINLAAYPLLKNAPTGLWGSKLLPHVNDQQFIDDALMGLKISTPKKPDEGSQVTVKKAWLMSKESPNPNEFTWESPRSLKLDGGLKTIKPIENEALKAIGGKWNVDLGNLNVSDFVHIEG